MLHGITVYGNPLVGLSKERPILGDHPKAHIHEIRRISWNSVDFRWNWQISCGFHLKSARFHADFTWNLPDFEWPIARNGNPMFLFCFICLVLWYCTFCSKFKDYPKCIKCPTVRLSIQFICGSDQLRYVILGKFQTQNMTACKLLSECDK